MRYFLILTLPLFLLAACSESDDLRHCQPDDCLPNGTCVEGPDGPYCECDDGYSLTRTLGDMLCVEDLSCRDDSDCSSGFCLKHTGHTEGFCFSAGCVTNDDCGPGRCCVEVDTAYFICLKIAEGYECGDGIGSCGDSCTGAIDSA
ncbi:MAG: hypothetical protein JRF33_23500 [Deltaproteobacteria bacterium]|nr:hypothetical protein [Deltaproteobacteria bacterium]